MFNYHTHTFRVLSGIHNIFLQLGKFFMRFNMMTRSDTSEHFKGSISKSSRIFESNMGRASNPQLTSATFGCQAVTLLNLSVRIQCRASPSNYDCGRAAFRIWQDPFSEPEGATIRARYVGLCRQSTPSPVHFTFLLQSKVLPVRKIFLLIFVLFHFSCKWIAAVVLWDCSHPHSPPQPHTGSSLLCVIIRLWRAYTYL